MDDKKPPSDKIKPIDDRATRRIPPPEPDEMLDESEVKPLLMVLGELDEAEREEMVRKANNDPKLAEELRTLSEHLKVHQAVRKVAPRRGSFSRFADTMRRQGHLDATTPGVHSMWRRSFGIAVIGMLLFISILFAIDEGPSPTQTTTSTATLRLFGNGQQSATTPEPVEFKTTYSVGERGGELWLPTGQRGVSTNVTLAKHTEFQLVSNSQVRLLSGWAAAVTVDGRARYEKGFILETPNARFTSHAGNYSIKISGEVSELCVARGRVEAKPLLGDTPGRIISEGMCSNVTRSQFASDPVGMLTLDIKPWGANREAIVTITNRSHQRLRIMKAGGPADLHFRLSVAQDTLPGSNTLPFADDFPILPVPGALPGAGSNASERGWITLDPRGSLGNNQYKFVTDLKAGMPGVTGSDVTVAVRYTGPVESDLLDTMELDWVSQYMRYDLKKLDSPIGRDG